MPKNKYIFCICGSSGSGKSTLIKILLKKNNLFQEWKTVTTRPIRENETQGDPYIFVSEEDVERMSKENDLLESERKSFNNYVYGKSKYYLETLDPNKIIITEEEIHQVDILKAKLPDYKIFSVYLAVDDMSQLKTRLINRGDSITSITKRLSSETIQEEKNKTLANYVIPSVQGNLDGMADIFMMFVKDVVDI